MASRPARKRAPKPPPSEDVGRDFGPGVAEAGAEAGAGRSADETERRFPAGPFPSLACAGEGCLFRPAANLVSRFALRMARGHTGSLAHAASSGIELMRALRDFLDEEIELAERAAGKRPAGATRFEKIEVE